MSEAAPTTTVALAPNALGSVARTPPSDCPNEVTPTAMAPVPTDAVAKMRTAIHTLPGRPARPDSVERASPRMRGPVIKTLTERRRYALSSAFTSDVFV